MTPVFLVRVPGLFTTVQDLGRRGFAAIGLPASGPMDDVALRLANGLVGNDADAPVLEILVQGPTLEAVADSVRIAFVGGTGSLALDDGRAIPVGRSVRLRRGETVKVGTLVGSSCGYLAVEGGFAATRSFGSASTYARGAIGGHEGRPLRAGDALAGEVQSVEARSERRLRSPLPASADDSIRVVLGPQDDHFPPEAIGAFLAGPYRVSPDADRMGYRLEGPVLTHARGPDIVSDGIVSGSIQVPGSGQPIVLMRDNQTAGGYPKIATVISADLSVLGRRGPGATVRFRAVSRTEAEAARRDQERFVAATAAAMVDVADEPAIDLAALYGANLVGGTVDALAE